MLSLIPREKRFQWLPGLLLINILFLYSTSRYGIGLPPDSAKYFSVAQSLSSGDGFRVFDGTSFCDAPPGYPLLLTPAYLLGMNPANYAWILNFLLIQIFIFLCWKNLKRAIPEPDWRLLALTGMLPYLFFPVFTEALTELPFLILLLTWMLLETESEVNTRRSVRTSLVLAGMVVLRYAGWMFVPGAIVYWVTRKIPLKQILIRISFPLIVTLIWMLRVQTNCGHVLGEHNLLDKFQPTGIYLFQQIMEQDFTGFFKTFFPLALLLAGTGIGFMNRHKVAIGKWFFWVAGSYLTLLFLQLNLPFLQLPRFLSVLFPLACMVTLIWFFKAAPDTSKWMLTAVLILEILISGYKGYRLQQNGAGGFHTSVWQDPGMRSALQHLPEGLLMSNYPDMVWWNTERECHYTPFLKESEEKFQLREGSGTRFLVWFKQTGREHVMKPDSEFVVRYPTRVIGGSGKIRLYQLLLP